MHFPRRMTALALVCTAVFLLQCQRSPSGPMVPSWTLPPFEKLDGRNPILMPASDATFTDPVTHHFVAWEARNVLNPTAVVKDNEVYLLYRAQDTDGTSRIGLARSKDGIQFTKLPTPVFFPEEDSMNVYEWDARKAEKKKLRSCCFFDGVEDPRVIEADDGTYIMTYTAYDGQTARLALASSTDLLTWHKHGLVLSDTRYRNMWSKSGAIVVEQHDHKLVAKKINGYYWMYFGDTQLFMARSTDLFHWEPLVDEESGALITVLHPRKGYFDSRLVEPGPHALYTSAGIVLVYNGSNAANYSDPALPKFTYAAGQALFDATVPYKLIDRTPGWFIHPDKPYERVGEVNEVCFVEGLVPFQGQWLLYYGTADSRIAVAVAPLEAADRN